MSYPPNAGAQVPSFKTNVNRAKTKRWVEAKSYTYDGDDWGDADEYDEYGGYDEPPPPPKPTGLRQQGQSAHLVHQSPHGSPTDLYQRSMDTSRQGYGNAGPAQQYGQRSATNPQPRIETAFGRSNSFDRGDEKRAFSAGGFQPGMTSPGSAPRQQMPYNQDQHHGTANIQPPMQFDPTQMRPVQPDVHRQYSEQQRQHVTEPARVPDQGYDRPSNHREPSYPDGPRYPSRESRAQSMTSNTSSMEIPNRRDFTPSALPPPLFPKGSPSSGSRPSSTHPPRKSSLSQTNQPPFPTSTQCLPSEPGATQRQRTSSDADKPLPFVRPADIYRRMQEEKEKGRLSQESSRPSMDANNRSPEHVGAHSDQALIEKEPDLNSPAMSPTARHILDSIEASEHGQMLQPELDSVVERRSEYAPETVYGEHRSSNNHEQASEVLGQEGAPVQSQASPRSAVQNTLSPVLPEVARMSSFGDSFLGSSVATGEPSLQAMLSSTSTLAPRTDQTSAANEASSGLQHHPSSGFWSVVNQAFDVADDQIPPTPTSTAGSGVERSTSGGTSAISPIISRGPSTTIPKANANFGGGRVKTPSLPEEGDDTGSRSISSGSVGTPKQLVGKPSSLEATTADHAEASPPPSFVPGHRRDLSTPSPNNSPARTPALETNKLLRQPQEAEMAMSTPTEPSFAPGAFQRDQAFKRESDASPTRSVDDRRKRSESPSKSRVRDLAGRFESASSSRRGSDQSLSQRGGSGASSPQRTEMPAPNRPLAADRMESFRPHLPGGWDSYVSNAPPAEMSRRGVNDREASPLREESEPSGVDHTGLMALEVGKATASSGAHEQENQSPLEIENTSKRERISQTSSIALGSKDRGSFDPSRTPRLSDDIMDKDTYLVTSRSSNPTIVDHREGFDTRPTRPLSGTQTSEKAREAPDYFQSATPVGAGEAPSERPTPLTRPSIMTPLSTDGGSHYESDRLRREIVRSLKPNAPTEPATVELDSPYQDRLQGPVQADVTSHGPAHESMVIPREYDSYWNGSESTSSTRSNSQHVKKVAPSAVQRHSDSPRVGDKVASPTSDMLSPRLQRLVSEPRIQDQRPTAPHRFSWDRASSAGEPGQELQQDPRTVDPEKRPVELNSLDSPTIGQSFQRDGMGLHDHDIEGQPERFGDRTPTYHRGSQDAEHQPGRQHVDEISRLPGHSDGAVEPAARATESGKATEHVPTPPQTAFRNTFSQDASLPPIPPSQSAQLKIPAFREISALKTPAERIRGYNDAREQFANLDTGLAQWLAVTATELPEHADVLSDVGRAPAAIMNYKPSSSRLLTGLRSTRPRSDMPETAGSSFEQGSSPSGGSSKLATQQVQAKGKDLLHNAGVFGGKANVAAKGLFSKGRSRFRGGIGADKDTTPPLQPLVQPPTNVRNVDFDIPTSSLSEDQPSHARPSYVQRVDALQSRGGGPETPHDETIPSSNFGSGDGSYGQTSVRNAQARAYPTRGDSLASANSHTIEGLNEDSGQIDSSGTTDDASNHYDQRQSAMATAPISQAFPDIDVTGSGSRTPTQVEFEDRVHGSPQSDKRTSPQQYFTSQAESLPDAIGPSARQESLLPKLLPIPKSRFSTQQADGEDIIVDSEADRFITQQSEAGRHSEDSNRTFHTAENGNDDRPESRQTQDDVETPKAAEPPQLTFQSVPSQYSAGSPQSQADNPSEPENLDTASGKLSKPPSSPETRALLARQPGLDVVSNVVQSNLPPSPVSPQRSFIQEPARPDNRKEPIYYDPSHDFGPASNDRVSAAVYNSPTQHSRGPSLVDHPAFRRDTSPARRSQTLAEQNSYGPGRGEAPSRQHPDMEADLGSGATPRNRTDESTPDAKRKSRNSGFFKAFKSPIGIADQAPGESDQIHATPAKVSVDGQKKSKRNSLFGSRNLDDRNSNGQSEESPPASISRIDTMRQQIPVTPDSKGSSSPSSGASNNLRNRQQRASTSGKKEDENGKKKRFSALGSLFGSRSRKTRPIAPEQSMPSQPVTFYQFGPPQQSQANERKLHQPLSQQRPQHPESRPSFQPSSLDSLSAQPRHDLVPVQNSDQRPHEEYYAPARSDHELSRGSTTAWSQTAQRISQARLSTNEPPAYAQDAALRHRSTAPPEGPSPGASRTPSTIPRSVTSNSPSTRSRSSMWSRSKSREVPFSERHDRSTSGNSWTTTAQDPSRQSNYNDPVSQSSQLALSPRPGITPTHSNHGRILTYSQFGDSSISYPPTQQITNIPSSGSHQPSPVRQQRQSVVTFQQFPQDRSNGQDSPPPPPPPPKDDGHVSRPRQSMFSQASNPRLSQEQIPSHDPRSSYAQHPTAEYPSSTGLQTRHNAPSSYIQQPTSEYQPTQHSQPRIFLEQPPAPSHSRSASHSSQSQRQSLPPLQTEVPNVRSSTFSPGNTSAESRKARQRELEMGGRPESAVRSAPMETATGPAKKGNDTEDAIVMSSSSYPGMEWTPERFEDDYTL